MRRSVFSITTIASSTTMPMASTSANSVSTLIVKPRIRRPRKVPITLTGTASMGMSVARQLWRKMNTTSVTSSIASTSVVTTSLMDAVTNGVVSNGILYCTPTGKLRDSSSIRLATACLAARALAPGRRYMSSGATGLPLSRPARS
jgi:hypothetical protein